MSTHAFEDFSARNEVPAGLALAVDFANTLDLREFGRFTPREFLGTTDDLAAWLRHRGFGERTCSEAELARAWSIRSAIREIAESHQSGALDPGRVRELSLALGVALQPCLDADGKLRLRGFEHGVPGALADILATIVTAEAEGTWCRVKMCSASDCRVVFYDYAKARNGRWCATTGCGNRVKTRTYRARRRAGSGGTALGPA